MSKVLIYSTRTCPFCISAEQLLVRKGVSNINKILVDIHPEARDIMVQRTGRRTVPQIFIGGKHIGGYDDLVELDRKGELAPLLNS